MRSEPILEKSLLADSKDVDLLSFMSFMEMMDFLEHICLSACVCVSVSVSLP